MNAFRRLVLVPCALLAACSTYPDWLSTSGPSREQVAAAELRVPQAVQFVELNDAVTRRVLASEQPQLFSRTFAGGPASAYVVGPGDMLEVTVWEAPPAVLFGTAPTDARVGSVTSSVTRFPDQMVTEEGSIDIPFAGTVPVSGLSPQRIAADIAKRLSGKANQPQVLVRVARNATANVTVVGEVAQSVRMPLTAKGERLLDAIASAGGTRQAVGKVTVQITRGDQVQALPLEKVIRSPAENVPLFAGDVVTLLFQPLSFIALGATGKNEEINFEAQGISLAQALARAGGVQDARADARGVFIFRFENPDALGASGRSGPRTVEGKVPVVYQLDLQDPVSFLVAQSFPMRNRDVIYVANAPSAELQKFLNILTASIFSIQNLVNLGL